jgi:hypothetical protein
LAEHSRRAGVGSWLAAAVALAGMITLSCTRQAGQPRPEEPTAGSSSSGTATPRPDDLDFCQVLTPADFPFEPSNRFPPKSETGSDGNCGWIANKGDNPFDDFLTDVGPLAVPFDRYKPPELAPNGRSTVIADRPAWVGTSLPSDVGTGCDAVFGSADRSIVIVLIDETENHPDPCQTVIELAEIVASRTPPPAE